MRFSFRLQSLLNWKRNLEEISQTRLVHKIKQLKSEEDEIQQLVRLRVENEQRLNEKIRQGIKIGEYVFHKTFGEYSYDELLTRKGIKKETESEVEEERERLIDLMKERKILEKLREKRLKKFIYHMGKLEQKSIDEIVVRQCQSTFKANLS